MREEKVILTRPEGLNAEVSTRFVQIASKYTARIMLLYEDKEVNAKSIMSLLTLAIPPGETLTIRAKGDDADEAIRDLTHYLATGEGSAYNISPKPEK